MLVGTLLTLAATALAAPLERISRRDLKAYVTDITVHESCAGPKRRMIQQGLKLTRSPPSPRTTSTPTAPPTPSSSSQLYFGTKPEAFPSAVGSWDALLHSNKDGVIIRCDDPDQNCQQPGWRGHWRGNNATAETVICDASYTDRVFNSAFCLNGFQLATTAPSLYWSIDLIHRLFHVPQVTNTAVGHYAEDLNEVIELAEHNSTFSPFDSDALQYFAAHVYALEVAQGGDACIGEIGHAHAEGGEATPAATTSAAAAPAATGNDCHSHADGTVHCGSH